MEPQIMIDPTMFKIIGAMIVMLLGVIAFFLGRLVNKVDNLSATVSAFDKDMTSQISVMQEKLRGVEGLYNRMRGVEEDITTFKAGGCQTMKDHLRMHGQ